MEKQIVFRNSVVHGGHGLHDRRRRHESWMMPCDLRTGVDFFQHCWRQAASPIITTGFERMRFGTQFAAVADVSFT